MVERRHCPQSQLKVRREDVQTELQTIPAANIKQLSRYVGSTESTFPQFLWFRLSCSLTITILLKAEVVATKIGAKSPY